MDNIVLYNDDCLNVLPAISDGSIDMILCDLPYGTTRNKWDSQIPLDKLWEQYTRVIKRNGCIALFAQTPFDKVLGSSNLDMLKYEWIWEKPMATGRLNCHFAPMKAHENILIFSHSAACYVKNANNAMIYHPQMSTGKPYVASSRSVSTNYDVKWLKEVTTVNNGSRFPRDVQVFKHDKEKFHPTQKPVALLEFLINTYTNENDIVLDNCMGSGSTGVACVNTNRRFIGIEISKEYYDIANQRINEAQLSVTQQE